MNHLSMRTTSNQFLKYLNRNNLGMIYKTLVINEIVYFQQ